MEAKARKREIRRESQSLRMNMAADEKRMLDEKIFKNFTAYYQRELSSWNRLYTYISTHQETDTRAIIAFFLKQGKQVAVPRVSGKKMDFYYITNLDNLIPGYMGILEPGDGAIKAEAEGLCLVPGLAFDQQGFRVGYGGGYYDRFLKSFSGPSIGLCYERQIRRDIPRESFDIRVMNIITDKCVH